MSVDYEGSEYAITVVEIIMENIVDAIHNRTVEVRLPRSNS
ncbi:hypothetical protein APHNP_0615 [Anaplasma phagocytophilum str. ApNP]|uniref:Uncharacterized protein n=2 Tax=Anaplasma phagocytophilum TaxID=948 RepID=A0A0F3NHZ3_ANAPH|nr:hypothetical protein APHMUC_0818 [Anaplasma phagocytophilum str. ApMUC09]KJV67630.1 hypothetical protein APHNP_0615 [Anaplasma phagocytophilum str. ApNP]